MPNDGSLPHTNLSDRLQYGQTGWSGWGEALVSRPKLTQVGEDSKVARTQQHTLCTTVPISHMYGHNYPRTFYGLINR